MALSYNTAFCAPSHGSYLLVRQKSKYNQTQCFYSSKKRCLPFLSHLTSQDLSFINVSYNAHMCFLDVLINDLRKLKYNRVWQNKSCDKINNFCIRCTKHNYFSPYDFSFLVHTAPWWDITCTSCVMICLMIKCTASQAEKSHILAEPCTDCDCTSFFLSGFNLFIGPVKHICCIASSNPLAFWEMQDGRQDGCQSARWLELQNFFS